MSKTTRDDLRILLVQARKDQQMKLHEISCFETSGNLSDDQVDSHDLLESPVGIEEIADFDAIIIGGSGDYSVLDDVPNLISLEDIIKEAKVRDLPVLGCCWGAQFLAKVFGGTIIRDPKHREVGTIEVLTTEAAGRDGLFNDLPRRFFAQAGHTDRVADLPPGSVLLASSVLCPVQAFTFPQSGMYGVQFHPELGKDDLVMRLKYYKENYVSDGAPVEEIISELKDTPEAAGLVGKWIDRVVLAGMR